MGHTITNSQNLIRVSGCYRPISSSAPQQAACMTAQGKKKTKKLGVCLWKHSASLKQNKTSNKENKLGSLLKAKTKD